MMKTGKQKSNWVDNLVVNLTSEFSKIPNFHLTQDDPDGNRLFNFIVGRFSEIHDFKTLFRRYYIPATNRAIVDAKKQIRNSRFKKIISITEEQSKENYYALIRLGYVGLFHKLESFINELCFEANLIFNTDEEECETIEEFALREYNWKPKDWYNDPFTHRINWIAICEKHYDGYPKKKPKYPHLQHLPEEDKIRIDQSDFYRDLEYVSDKYYLFRLRQIFTLGAYKNLMSSHENGALNQELEAQFIDLKLKMQSMMATSDYRNSVNKIVNDDKFSEL
jgi:hypothetical protein